ncbi:hypothetical protein FM036_26645 [Nostoc sp. HG1]|nr:hypothetical protein [Nostoc sp. HG1]
MNGNIRLRYLYCRRHIGFFQQLFRGLEKFIQGLGVGTGHWALGIAYSPCPLCLPYADALCPMPYALCPMPYALCPMPQFYFPIP